MSISNKATVGLTFLGAVIGGPALNAAICVTKIFGSASLPVGYSVGSAFTLVGIIAAAAAYEKTPSP
jgi:hypothetical protein